ncbi:NADH dehydrogenase [ubiquinone] 1 alpha subcomplex subunit 9, mitochondrial-like [Oppia nitens]|uniref:NADH dehydrogenase [ubiquinone] 1 alpha subcomplex subunit 9, mitochondrial-like n=1 Tax=Oppia nitens TaxID=1686743 RepID=UPI0023DBA46B|nr:NADH dehydrogenase [ubiquinone] 1 alpha subcomplex subunit 9, mitochondrial-like [Oppia nitens]
MRSVFAMNSRVVVFAKRRISGLPSAAVPAVYPNINRKQLKRGTGGRSSFNGQVVTVFGGGGFVGKYVLNELAKTGTQVVIPFRGDFFEVQRLKVIGDLGQVQFRKFDLRDEESVFECLRHSTAVINLIGKDIETNNFSFEKVHAIGAQTIARCVREAGIQRFLHVSTANASPRPTPHLLKSGSGFLRSKWKGEQLVRQEMPSAIIVRPTDIHGLDDNFCQYFARWQRRQYGKVPLFRGGFHSYKQPVFVKDVAQAVVQALQDPNAPANTYELFGPRRYTLRALVEYINRCIQKPEEEGFRVTNLRWSPSFMARVYLFSALKGLFKYPSISLERLERECVSDVRQENTLGFEDLGICAEPLEDKWEYHLMQWRRQSYYGEEVSEFVQTERPPQQPIVQ